MSVKFSGSLTRSGGVYSAIGKQIKQLNLKAVKRITVTFDPFNENVKPTRYVITIMRMFFSINNSRRMRFSSSINIIHFY